MKLTIAELTVGQSLIKPDGVFKIVRIDELAEVVSREMRGRGPSRRIHFEVRGRVFHQVYGKHQTVEVSDETQD